MGAPDPARRRRLLAAVFGVLNLSYATLITCFALSPTPPRIGVRDWLMHGVAFALQAVLVYCLLRPMLPPPASAVLAAAAAIAFGGMIEVFQIGVPGRFFELSDLLANAVGATSAAVTLAARERWRRQASRVVSG